MAVDGQEAAENISEKQTVQTPETRVEIPAVSKELCAKTREALAEQGYTFVVAIQPLSVSQLESDTVIFQRFGYINPLGSGRDIVPPQMEIAINPNSLRIKDSNNLTTDQQMVEIEKRKSALKAKLPQEVRDLIGMSMLNASVLAQLDEKYQKETGRVLFTDWCARTDDPTVPGFVANVGRVVPTHKLRIDDWYRDRAGGDVFAFDAVVLPRELAV